MAVFNGARAKIYVDNVLVAIFDNCSYSVNIGTEDVFILGRYSASEITPVSYEVVTVNCSGFRVIGNGAHVLPKFPKLQDLLNLESVTLSMVDRQADAGDEPVMTVVGCVPISYNTGAAAKSNSKIQISYKGLRASDEEGAQDEGDGTILPS
jgi:hypothetical protein